MANNESFDVGGDRAIIAISKDTKTVPKWSQNGANNRKESPDSTVKHAIWKFACILPFWSYKLLQKAEQQQWQLKNSGIILFLMSPTQIFWPSVMMTDDVAV